MSSFLQDLRYAMRTLRRAPAFSVAAVLTIGVAVGVTTAVFGIVNAVLLRPLPYPEQDRLLDVSNAWAGTPRAGISPAEFFDYYDAVGRTFVALGAYGRGAANLVGTGEPLRLRAGYASADVLPALGMTPAVGRWYTEEEERAGAAVALISHGLWSGRFGGDPGVLDRAVTLDGAGTRIVGVLPAGFALPDDYAAAATTDVVLPLGLNRATVTARGSHFLRAVGRLAPGVRPEQAQAALRGIVARFVAEFPDDYPRDMAFAVDATPLADRVAGDARRPLLLLLGGAAFVLLVACANVANLMLVRLDARRAELAVRTAVGAGRGRLLRQVLTETVTLGAAGGALGAMLAWWSTRLLLALRPPGIPRFDELSLDTRVLAFAGAIAVGAGLLVGILPALRAADLSVATVLRGTGRGAGRGGVRRGLVVTQVAVALTLLVGAGLLGRSLAALWGVDPGFRPAHVVSGRVTLPTNDYPDVAQVIAGFEAIRTRVAALPGVVAAGGVTNLPLATTLGDINIRIEGRTLGEGEVSPLADWQAVTPGYFEAMGLQLRRGRFLDARDREDAPGAVVINETMARQYWPGEDPLGTRFTLGGNAGPGTVTVVGVVGDVRHAALSEPRTSQMYLAHAQFRFWNGGSVVRTLTVVARGAGELDPASLRSAIQAVDPRLPVAQVQRLEDVVTQSLSRERFLFALAITFAAVALALGALGVYGLLAYAVARRTREIGLRLALGARTRDVSRLVTREGTRLVAVGVGLGSLGALGLTRLLRGLIFGVAPLDPVTLLGAPAALGAVALLAAWLPARRAARLDPMEALRHE